MKTLNKILIFRLSSIGDIILTSALIRCIRNKYPDAEISYVVKKEFYDLLKYNPNITKLISFDKKDGFKGLLKLRKQIKKAGYDWFIDIHNNIRSNIVKRGSHIPVKTRYHKKVFYRTLLINFKINKYRDYKPVLLRYFEAVEKSGVIYDENGTEVFYCEDEKNSIDDVLKKNGYDESNIAVICPGASYTNKQWKPDGFAHIAKYLKDEKNLDVVLLGGKNDIESCEKINKLVETNFLNLAGKLKLLESAALLNLSKLTITNDSGMMHMAQSQNSPVIAIFGPTTRELGYFPLLRKSSIVEVDIPCRPCTPKGLNYCPKKHFNCMNNIDANMVINEINKFI